jgi:hypothetical protein
VNIRMRLALAVTVIGALAVGGTAAIAGGGPKQSRGALGGYQEVPAVSSTGSARFEASLNATADAIAYKLSYSGLEGDITQSHIHFGQRGVNGGIVTVLCTNLGNGPAGTQACPPAPATVEGTIEAADIVGSAAAQGIAAGEFAEVLRAIKSGMTYANVHTTKHPGGEVRSQLRGGWGRGGRGR